MHVSSEVMASINAESVDIIENTEGMEMEIAAINSATSKAPVPKKGSSAKFVGNNSYQNVEKTPHLMSTLMRVGLPTSSQPPSSNVDPLVGDFKRPTGSSSQQIGCRRDRGRGVRTGEHQQESPL